MLSPSASATPVVSVSWYRHLYLQVVVAIVIGILLGHFEPKFAVTLQPLGDAGFAARALYIPCLSSQHPAIG